MNPRTTARVRGWLATAAMVGVLLYVVVDVVLQMLPPHYSAISDAESNLAVGPFGWVMNLNFVGRAVLTGCAIGALALCGGAGRLRNSGLGLLAVAGVLSGLLAFFATDVGEHGIATTTPTGAVHLMLATTAFIAALAAFAVLTVWLRAQPGPGGQRGQAGPGGMRGQGDTGGHPGLRRPGLRRAYPWALGYLLLAVGGIVFLGTAIVAVPQVLGLAERVCLAGILGWVFAVCSVVRSLPERVPAEH